MSLRDVFRAIGVYSNKLTKQVLRKVCKSGFPYRPIKCSIVFRYNCLRLLPQKYKLTQEDYKEIARGGYVELLPRIPTMKEDKERELTQIAARYGKYEFFERIFKLNKQRFKSVFGRSVMDLSESIGMGGDIQIFRLFMNELNTVSYKKIYINDYESAGYFKTYKEFVQYVLVPLLHNCCGYNHLALLEYICHMYKYTIDYYLNRNINRCNEDILRIFKKCNIQLSDECIHNLINKDPSHITEVAKIFNINLQPYLNLLVHTNTIFEYTNFDHNTLKAALSSSLEVCKYMYDLGYSFEDLILTAIKRSDIEIIKWLFETYNIPTNAWLKAVELNNVEILELLAEFNVDMPRYPYYYKAIMHETDGYEDERLKNTLMWLKEHGVDLINIDDKSEIYRIMADCYYRGIMTFHEVVGFKGTDWFDAVEENELDMYRIAFNILTDIINKGDGETPKIP